LPGSWEGVLLVSDDLLQLAREVVPYASAAVVAYGGAVLVKARDEAADATVGLGRQWLQRIFGSHQDGDLPKPVADVVANPANKKALAELQRAIHKALAASQELQDEVRGVVGRPGGVTQTVHAGGDAYVVGRDSNNHSTTINNFAPPVGSPALGKPAPAVELSGIDLPVTQQPWNLEFSTDPPRCRTRPGVPVPQQTPRLSRRKSRGNEYNEY
jgi:hypothetical protein